MFYSLANAGRVCVKSVMRNISWLESPTATSFTDDAWRSVKTNVTIGRTSSFFATSPRVSWETKMVCICRFARRFTSLTQLNVYVPISLKCRYVCLWGRNNFTPVLIMLASSWRRLSTPRAPSRTETAWNRAVVTVGNTHVRSGRWSTRVTTWATPTHPRGAHSR